jgi:hypothetical protein
MAHDKSQVSNKKLVAKLRYWINEMKTTQKLKLIQQSDGVTVIFYV